MLWLDIDGYHCFRIRNGFAKKKSIDEDKSKQLISQNNTNNHNDTIETFENLETVFCVRAFFFSLTPDKAKFCNLLYVLHFIVCWNHRSVSSQSIATRHILLDNFYVIARLFERINRKKGAARDPFKRTKREGKTFTNSTHARAIEKKQTNRHRR